MYIVEDMRDQDGKADTSAGMVLSGDGITVARGLGTSMDDLGKIMFSRLNCAPLTMDGLELCLGL
jgi:hypothetical protein